jgi:macrodomain Ter protein organizer (MatP/YcbG family)
MELTGHMSKTDKKRLKEMFKTLTEKIMTTKTCTDVQFNEWKKLSDFMILNGLDRGRVRLTDIQTVLINTTN